MALELPPLPFAYDALQPFMSARTLEFHHDKHHAAYVTNGNKLAEAAGLSQLSTEDLIRAAAGDPARAGLFNNAAQVWNHTFFWESIKPGGGGPAVGRAAELIQRDFGSYESFKEKFQAAAVGQFGSGWAWLVLDQGQLKIVTTGNAGTPLTAGQTALSVVDVWEHAYYLDFQNRRPDFVKTFLENLISWDAVNDRLSAA